MDNQTYKCPLCESILTREIWIRITGQWEERQKFIIEAKKAIDKYKKQEEELKKKYQEDIKKATKLAEESGVAKGVKKEQSERIRMSKMLQNQTKALQANSKKIQELEKQLKEGKTPQTAGFEYEKEVQKMLTSTFPSDKVHTTGKMGDVLQIVVSNNEDIGSILYECKRTERYSNGFVREIKGHQDAARADYAVIVTHAQKENKSKFFIDDKVIIIDPLGLLDLAFLLRNILIDMHRMKLTKEQTDQKGREILRYMQTGEFKKNMVDSLEKARSAYNLLIKEVNSHKKDWEERLKIYSAIHQNTQNVRYAIGKIITGTDLPQENGFPSFTIPPLQLASGDSKGGDN